MPPLLVSEIFEVSLQQIFVSSQHADDDDWEGWETRGPLCATKALTTPLPGTKSLNWILSVLVF